ncbi:MAG: DUF2795 domain-containing protein, partial [Actinobacteria bacterium]
MLLRRHGVAELHGACVPTCRRCETWYIVCMFARVAELQTLLEGVPLPAGKRELLDYARSQADGDVFLGLLSGIPDREYRSLDD